MYTEQLRATFSSCLLVKLKLYLKFLFLSHSLLLKPFEYTHETLSDLEHAK